MDDAAPWSAGQLCHREDAIGAGVSSSAQFCLSAPTQDLMAEAAVGEVEHRSAPGSGASEASSV